MRKTLIICDSACDLSIEQEKKIQDFKILNCGIEMNGLPYEERVEVSADDVYAEVEKSGVLPKTSQVTVIQFVEAFAKAARDGYTDIICVTMNAKGSGTFNSAVNAKEMLTAEYPQLEGKLNIYVVDSCTYSYVIAMPLIKAREQLEKGESPERVAEDLQNHFKGCTTLIGVYNLQYAKKSGRLNACAAFVGDMLGLKPIMAVCGENKVLEKVRGDKNLAPRMAQLYAEKAADIKGDYIIAHGTNSDQAKDLVAELKKLGAKAPVYIGPIGTAVGINVGPKMLGLGFKVKE